MAIVTTKMWAIECEGTTPQGTRSCPRETNVIRAGDDSPWVGPIWNRGQLDTHLRRTGWTIGTVVLCPACKRGDA